MSELVSVIIPTYNRFKYVLNAIDSVKRQTYPNIEIIVVNDNSTQPQYREYNWDIRIIHLPQNSKEIFGYACAGFVRNQGIKIANGKYIAFLDDDDIFFPNKIDLQLKRMNNGNYRISCSDGLIGNGIYDVQKSYKKYNGEFYFKTLKNWYNSRSTYFKDDFPDVWDLDFLKYHNCVITSSVLVEKSVLDEIGNFKEIPNSKEDYELWLRILAVTNCAYLKDDILFYYDKMNGDGRNY